jgi:hypothetical protein
VARDVRKRSRVPRSALERVGRVGWLMGELAVGGAVEGVRRLAGRGNAHERSALLSPANGRRLAKRLANMLLRVLEREWSTSPKRRSGSCGRSDLAARLRDAALSLAFDTGNRRPPPPETLFLQRKLAGTFLLCARLRARVPLRALTEEALPAA